MSRWASLTELFIEVQALQRDQCLRMAANAHFSKLPNVRDECFERAAMFDRKIASRWEEANEGAV